MSSLTVCYVPDTHGDEVGKLWFDLKTKHFSGSGFFWSNLTELPELIGQIGAFPIGEKLTWKWGYDTKEGDDAVLLLSLAPVDNAGGLEMTVQIADLNDTSQRVAAKLKPDYATLGSFQNALLKMLENRSGKAMLEMQ